MIEPALPEPRPDENTSFTIGDRRYHLEWRSDHWMLYRHRGGKQWTPIASIRTADSRWFFHDRRGNRSVRYDARTFNELLSAAL